jgi:hypothetical protein
VIRLNVAPMNAPKPALRYLLLPELKEMTPGNPIPNYLKCFLDQDFSADQEVLGPAALRQADRAARMDTPDWSILPKLRTDGIGLLLPDLQKLRDLARGLEGRFRDEAALRQFDDAVYTARTMFAMSRHLGEHPTLVGNLVGISVASTAIAPLEEMLERPGCPNLYWALTNLPTPLVPLDRGMEGERVLIRAELHSRAGLDDVAPMTPEQVKKLGTYIDRLCDKGVNTRAWLDERTGDEAYLAAARARVVESGIPEDRVARFPPDQVILLDEEREYVARRDEIMKVVKLPAWEALAAGPGPKKGPSLFSCLLPGVDGVQRAQGRLEQRIALLRHVEALRAYAAGHDGAWPAALGDVGLPLPADPFTGKPFRYSVEGATAHLRGSPPKGAEKAAVYNVRYEITIRK